MDTGEGVATPAANNPREIDGLHTFITRLLPYCFERYCISLHGVYLGVRH
ncbi:hypothetical protein LINPERHAP1_LOCUS17792, partial [Linum perenne]